MFVFHVQVHIQDEAINSTASATEGRRSTYYAPAIFSHLWSPTLTLDLWTWYRCGQDEPLCQISRSNFV